MANNPSKRMHDKLSAVYLKRLSSMKVHEVIVVKVRKKFMRFFSAIALLTLSHAAVAGLFGGNDPEISRRLASGAIGCPANEVGISNEQATRGIHTFTAHCKGREYFCTYKYPAPISCSQSAGTTDADCRRWSQGSGVFSIHKSAGDREEEVNLFEYQQLNGRILSGVRPFL